MTPYWATKNAVINPDDLDFDGMALEEDTEVYYGPECSHPTRMPGFFGLLHIPESSTMSTGLMSW